MLCPQTQNSHPILASNLQQLPLPAIHYSSTMSTPAHDAADSNDSPLLDTRPLPAILKPAAFVWSSPLLLWILAMVPFVIALTVGVRSIRKETSSLGNFPTFRDAAIAMTQGTDIYRSGQKEYVYPPLLAFLYQPLGHVSRGTGAAIAMTLSLAMAISTLIIASTQLLFRISGRSDDLSIARTAVIAAILSATHIRSEFNMFETNVLMLFMFTLAMRWVDRRPALCGLALAVAFHVKYLPIVLIPYLLLRRRWAAVGWFFVACLVLAILPAVSMGWHANLTALSHAFAGIARLFGVTVDNATAANVIHGGDARSISVTSALIRIPGLTSPWPLVIAALLGGLLAGITAAIYRKRGLPVFNWPDNTRQTISPWRGLLAVEWIAVMALMVVFSPFTNTRHLYLLVDLNVVAAVLFVATRGWLKVCVAGAAILSTLCTVLPPSGDHFEGMSDAWRWIGGPAWCALLLCAVCLWLNARLQSRPSSQPTATIPQPPPTRALPPTLSPAVALT